MADQWKAKITTIAGNAVAIVDVKINRTIMVDAEVYERFQNLLRHGEDEETGLEQVATFFQLVQTLPPDSHRFVVVPWTDADNNRIGLRPFSEIVNYFEDRMYFRVEGTAESGYTGYFNFGAKESEVDLSEQAIPAFIDKLESTKNTAQAVCDSGQLKPAENAQIRGLCDNCRSKAEECLRLYTSLRELIRAKEEAERKQKERELRDAEKLQTRETTAEGDFPKGWGRDFGNMA